MTTGGATTSGGATGLGGAVGRGGATSIAGSGSLGGTTSSGGASGGTNTAGFSFGSGGRASGGASFSFGGASSGGRTGNGSGGAAPAMGGAPNGSGGKASSGGATGTAGSGPVDCSTPMPTGGTDHCGQNTQGNAGGNAWSLWTNQLNSNACITTFSTTAFSARWNGNNDFLARVGLEFGNGGKSHDQYGTIKADFSFKKNGAGGGYSYIGIYGWTTNPCVEWYIVDDRYGTMPFDAWQANAKGGATIDGAQYKFFQNKTPGTGGSRCGNNITQWDQYWSIRQSARQCGTITVSEHFKAWEAAGLTLGNLLEAKILVETGGDMGSIDFPVAKVTAN